MNIVFMGSCDFSLHVLNIVHKKYPVSAIYTAPPRPKGRGHCVQATCMHHYGVAHTIPVYTPKSLRDPVNIQQLEALKPDLIVVASYGLLLPKAVLDLPPLGCLNIHPSLLPRWRGASPVASAIAEGDTVTGVCVMLMDEGMDTGPLLWSQSIALDSGFTTQTLSQDLATLGAYGLCDLMESYRLNICTPIPQKRDGITISRKISKAQGLVQWHMSAPHIVLKVRAYGLSPGVWADIGSHRVKLLRVSALSSQNTTASLGSICNINGYSYVACADQTYLQIHSLQSIQGKVMALESFLCGHRELMNGWVC